MLSTVLDSDWEGGVRGAAFVAGGLVPPAMRGSKNADPMHLADWYTTFAALSGADPTDYSAAEAGLPPVDGALTVHFHGTVLTSDLIESRGGEGATTTATMALHIPLCIFGVRM